MKLCREREKKIHSTPNNNVYYFWFRGNPTASVCIIRSFVGFNIKNGFFVCFDGANYSISRRLSFLFVRGVAVKKKVSMQNL